MIEVQLTKPYRLEDPVQGPPGVQEPLPAEWENLAEAAFTAKEDHEREFDALLKVVLSYFSLTHDFYGLFSDNFPRKKSNLRTHKGFAYGLKKQIPAADYAEKEYDLPDDRSVFLALIRFREDYLFLFLDHLIDSSFVAGLLVEKSADLSPARTAAILDTTFEKAVRVHDMVTVDSRLAAAHLVDEHALAFRTGVDDRDQEYLALYGRPDYLEPRAESLTAHLEKHFYLRHRQVGRL